MRDGTGGTSRPNLPYEPTYNVHKFVRSYLLQRTSNLKGTIHACWAYNARSIVAIATEIPETLLPIESFH